MPRGEVNEDPTEFAGTERYRPLRLLGRGGMGAVYEVEDQATGGRVALKVMLDGGAERLLRFKQEFRVVAELAHPNLVRLFEMGRHEGRWFFTMELVRGLDLLAVFLQEEDVAPASSATFAAPRTFDDALGGAGEESERRPMACDPDVLVPVVTQILDALEFLHGRGIVHGDLKPSNVLVDPEGTVRLVDFGLAGRLDRAERIARQGVLVGTLAYLSPEQCEALPASTASDLYALGCVMFELCAGAPPFPGTPAQSVAKRVTLPPPRLDERVTDAPPALAAIIHRLMAREPEARPSLAEVRAALGRAPGRRPATVSRADEGGGELFVGRRRELDVLAGCLERALEGNGPFALVSGASGVGKSALASVLERRARDLGFLCLRGRCYEREQVPFVAFDRVMDEVALTLRRWPEEHLAAVRPSLRVLRRVFPVLALTPIDVEGGRTVATPDPRERYGQVFDALREVIARWQRHTPLCFVLDDLQWADEESVALLEALLEGGAGRVMVLGLYRPDGVGDAHPLARLLRKVEGAEHATALPLAALATDDAAHLVDAVTGGLEPGTVRALVSQAEGNPFLLRRLAGYVATLAPAERSARLDDVVSTGDLLRRTMQPLGPNAAALLALAATAGGDIAAPLLREASGVGGEDFDLAVGELVAGRFLKVVPAGPEGAGGGPVHLDLYHDRIREVVYLGLAEGRRRDLHRDLGRALESRAAEGGRDAEALVRHFGAAGDRPRKRRYALEAAEQAAERLAFIRAARLFRVALDDPEPGEAPLVAARRWERAGELFEYGGDHREAAHAYREALRRWDEAPAGEPERPTARLRLAGLVGINLMATDRVVEGRAAFARGLALLGLPLERSVPRRNAALLGLGCRLAVARLAPRRAPAKDEAFLAAQVRFFDGVAWAFGPLWPRVAAEAALRVALLGPRAEDARAHLRALAFRAFWPVFVGRCSAAQLARAHRRLDEADAFARAHDVPLGREMVQLNRAVVWLGSDANRARRACEDALAGLARRGLLESYDGNIARVFLLHVLACKGDDDDVLAAAERELDAARSNFINVTVALCHKVRVLASRGLHREARASLERMRDHLAGIPPSRVHFHAACASACVLVAEGRFAEALERADAEERAAKESGAWAIGFDRSFWFEAQLEAAVGRLRAAGLTARQRDRARGAARWLAEQGVLDFGCLGHRALAHLEHAAGRAGPARRAIERALALSSANTSPVHRWRCVESARELGVATRRHEAEAAALAARGRFAREPNPRG